MLSKKKTSLSIKCKKLFLFLLINSFNVKSVLYSDNELLLMKLIFKEKTCRPSKLIEKIEEKNSEEIESLYKLKGIKKEEIIDMIVYTSFFFNIIFSIGIPLIAFNFFDDLINKKILDVLNLLSQNFSIGGFLTQITQSTLTLLGLLGGYKILDTICIGDKKIKFYYLAILITIIEIIKHFEFSSLSLSQLFIGQLILILLFRSIEALLTIKESSLAKRIKIYMSKSQWVSTSFKTGIIFSGFYLMSKIQKLAEEKFNFTKINQETILFSLEKMLIEIKNINFMNNFFDMIRNNKIELGVSTIAIIGILSSIKDEKTLKICGILGGIFTISGYTTGIQLPIIPGIFICLASLSKLLYIKKDKRRREELEKNKEDIQDNRTEEVIVTQETKSNGIILTLSSLLVLGLIGIIALIFNGKNNIESTKVII